MGLLDKASKEKDRQDIAIGGRLAEPFPFGHRELEALGAEISALALKAAFPLEAYLRISETLPLDPFALVIDFEGKAVTLASRGAKRAALVLPAGGFSDLLSTGSGIVKTPANKLSGSQAKEIPLSAAGPGTFHLLDEEGKVRGTWHLGLSRFAELDRAILTDLKALFASIRIRTPQAEALRPPRAETFSKLVSISRGSTTSILGFRIPSPALGSAKEIMELSEAGAAFALGSALRRALGENALLTATAARISAFVVPDLPCDPELYLAQLRRSLRRSLPSFAKLAAAPIEAVVFGQGQTLGKDLERFALD